MAEPRPGVSDTATVFTHGDGQAVRLPAGYRFDTDEVIVRREGDDIILSPKVNRTCVPRTAEEWEAFWAEVDAIGDPASPFPDPPPQTITPPKAWDD